MKNRTEICRVDYRWSCLLISAALVAAGCATNQAAAGKGQLATGSSIATSTMPLAIGDLVTVRFSGTEANIPPHEVHIQEDGNITLPLIVVIRADGKTVQELEKEIRDWYVPDANFNLSITVTGGQMCYFVGGQVRSCGRLLYLGPTTVTKAIEAAGGFTDFADRGKIELIRNDGKTIRVNYERAVRNPARDPAVYPGNRVIAPMRGPHSDMFQN